MYHIYMCAHFIVYMKHLWISASLTGTQDGHTHL